MDLHITENGMWNPESVVMVRNIGRMLDPHNDRQQFLSRLAGGCRAIRLANEKGAARAKCSDVGGMIPIGTRIIVKNVDPANLPLSTARFRTLQTLVLGRMSSVGLW
jgi:hypothetical protein